jgi:hypothetical protein
VKYNVEELHALLVEKGFVKTPRVPTPDDLLFAAAYKAAGEELKARAAAAERELSEKSSARELREKSD